MKKHKLLVKTISGILSFVLISMSMFALFVSANNTEPIACVSDHFSKLKYNHNGVAKYRIPQNQIGTCTHSAMSMILSFYDFYWHDSFVPTIYESDGTYHQMGWENGIYNSTTNTVIETFTAYPEANAWDNWNGDFESFADNNEIKYLQPYLMSIAESETLTGAMGIVGMLDFQVVRVLEEYLSRRGLGPDQGVEVHIEYGFPTPSNLEASREILFNTIKTKINEGHPVMFLGLDHIDVIPEVIDGSEWGIYAHAMVAYDVVEKDGEEDIVLHTGWNFSDTQYFNSTPYTKWNSAIWIEIDEEKLPHQCAEKYYDVVTGNSLCACQIYSKHPSHTTHHLFTDKYDSSYHYQECFCGEKINSCAHTLTYSSPSDTKHFEACGECDYSSYQSHVFKGAVQISSTHHQTACACGLTGETEEHYHYSYARNTKANHHVYCECGYYIGTSFHIVPIGDAIIKFCIHCGQRINTKEDITIRPWGTSPTRRYITDAGSYVDSDGVIYLTESDMELYLAGELDVYALVNNNGGTLS